VDRVEIRPDLLQSQWVSTIVGFEDQGAESRSIDFAVFTGACESRCDGVDFLSTPDVSKGAIEELVPEDLREDDLVVIFPNFASVILDHHGSKEVAVEIAVGGVPTKFHVPGKEGKRLANDLLAGLSDQLSAIRAGCTKSGSVRSSMKIWGRVSDGAAGHLIFFDVVNARLIRFEESLELELGLVTRGEREEVPGSLRNVAGPRAVSGIGVIPASCIVLGSDHEPAGFFGHFFELGNLLSKTNFADEISFGESLGRNGVFVDPVMVFKIETKLASIFGRQVDKVLNGIQDTHAELIGLRGFAMSKKA